MTAIYGIVNFDGSPVVRDWVKAMGAAIHCWGPDGGGAWTRGDAALGQKVLATTAEASFERGPLALRSCTLVAAGRLDNRDELANELDVARKPQSASESEIIASAYERWGESAPERLFGDWAFAAWHPNERRLFLARDHLGHTALYYHFTGTTLAFASTRKALFALSQVPRRLNELRLAQHLTTWVVDGESTLHERIFRVPPGNVLQATASGIRLTRYWHPQELGELEPSSDDAYIEQFLGLYTAAVRTRMRSTGTIVTTLSAGLDSGSVTALAAAEARQRGETLLAMTSRPRFPEISEAATGALVDEWPLAQAVAGRWGNLRHKAIFAQRITPLQAFRRSLELHDEPDGASPNLPWVHDLLQASQEHGARVVLTGEKGNATISWTGDRQLIPRLFAGGRAIEAMRRLLGWKSEHGATWAGALWTQLVAPMLLRAQGVAFRNGWRSQSGFARSLANPRFYARMKIAQRMRASGYDPFFSMAVPPIEQRLAILLPEISPFGALWHERGAGYGLDVRDPTGDIRLLEFCLRLPDDQYGRKGHDRSLIRRAMEGILPPEVQWNSRRGMQGADIALRLHADASEMDAAVEDISRSAAARDYLDVPTLQLRWEAIRENPLKLPAREVHSFGRGLQFGLFLADGF